MEWIVDNGYDRDVAMIITKAAGMYLCPEYFYTAN